MYNHARTVVIAATLALLAMMAWQLLGFRDAPRTAICAQAGYELSDSGLARCADHYGWDCGDPRVDIYRPGCP